MKDRIRAQGRKKKILSIIIPAYNEETTILELVRKVKNVDLSPLAVEKEIIIIDDASRDNTLNLIKPLDGIKFTVHKQNIGKGAAVQTGIKLSTGDFIIIQDADLELDPNDYLELLKPMIQGNERVVYGSRFLKKENKKSSSLVFYLGAAVVTWIANLLYLGLNITDEATCYKLFDARLLKSIKLESRRFEFCPEVTAKLAKKGIKIREVPVSYYPRASKEGKKIKWKDGLIAIWTLIKLRFTD